MEEPVQPAAPKAARRPRNADGLWNVLTVLGLLISTSRLYTVADTWLLLTAVILLCGGLIALGAFLITRSVYRIRAYDHMVREIKRQSPTVAPYLD